jgi:predicted MFS family arabinose efflux permease
MPAWLMPAWGLTNAEAGLMASAYTIGYMLAVPVLTTLTDRMDARAVLLAGSLASALATIAFGLFAHDLLSASLLWALAGIGFAGAYMPGLKALTDRLESGDASRSITLYTATFSLGVGLSFLVAQLVAAGHGWRAAFLVTGAAPLLMVAVAWGMKPVRPPPASGQLLDFRPVLNNRPAMGYILGYGAHCFELYGMRTWIVAFWTFVVAHNAGAAPLDPVAVSVGISLLAMPASIIGNECALRFGRHRTITAIMLLSAITALAIGMAAGVSPWILLALVLLYALTVPGDSGSLTAGMAGAADVRSRGATMALHSTVGFGLSSLGAWGVGVALDLGGGAASASGWLAGFTVMAAGGLLGPLVLWWSRAPRTAP